MARYWPEFAAHGKESVTVRQLLSHQAGLVGLPGGIPFEELRDSAVAAARLADTFTYWHPGSMCFGIVYMKPHQEVEFASYRAFGHDGAGGALAFADPAYAMGFGYILMPIAFPGAADPKGVHLSKLVWSCIRLRS